MSTFTNISSETTRLIEANYYAAPPWHGGTKVCLNGPGHMTKMAAMSIYGENLKNLLLRNQKTEKIESWMQHRVLKYYQVCSNDDPGLTMTDVTARSNLVPYAFVWEKGKKRL